MPECQRVRKVQAPAQRTDALLTWQTQATAVTMGNPSELGIPFSASAALAYQINQLHSNTRSLLWPTRSPSTARTLCCLHNNTKPACDSTSQPFVYSSDENATARKKRGINWNNMVPLLYAPTLPLSTYQESIGQYV